MDNPKPSDAPKAPSPSTPCTTYQTVEVEKEIEILGSFKSSKSNTSQRSRPQHRWRELYWSLIRQMSTKSVGKRRAWYARAVIIFVIIIACLGLAFLTWTLLYIALIHRLSPVIPRNGLTTLVGEWREPTSDLDIAPSWLPNFSSGVTPKPIHSHNDYTRDVPLFRALSVGCMGVEADIHLVNDDLFVGHTARDLRTTRTLSSLYLNPLMEILQSQNEMVGRLSNSGPLIGVFNDRPQESLILLLDFKTAPEQALPKVMSELQPFKDAGYLTRWNGSNVVQAPLTIVASGFMSQRLELQSQTDGTVFLDPHIDALAGADGAYNVSNSLYASARLHQVVGGIDLRGMKQSQRDRVATLVKDAQDSGLKARFWDTPSWPISKRDEVWKQLIDAGVGMLNADDVKTASLWNWNWCNMAGIRLC